MEKEELHDIVNKIYEQIYYNLDIAPMDYRSKMTAMCDILELLFLSHLDAVDKCSDLNSGAPYSKRAMERLASKLETRPPAEEA